MPHRKPPIAADMPVDAVMTAHRGTIALFIRRGMLCVGCPVGRIHDVADACAAHGVPLEGFLADLNRLAAAPR